MDKTGEDLSGLHHSQLLCGHDFANERLLVCQIDVERSQLAKLNNIAKIA